MTPLQNFRYTNIKINYFNLVFFLCFRFLDFTFHPFPKYNISYFLAMTRTFSEDKRWAKLPLLEILYLYASEDYKLLFCFLVYILYQSIFFSFLNLIFFGYFYWKNQLCLINIYGVSFYFSASMVKNQLHHKKILISYA